MGKRYVTQVEFEWFREWVNKVGKNPMSPNTNRYELVRWKVKGEAMAICFRSDNSDLVTLNTSAAKLYDGYMKSSPEDVQEPLKQSEIDTLNSNALGPFDPTTDEMSRPPIPLSISEFLHGIKHHMQEIWEYQEEWDESSTPPKLPYFVLEMREKAKESQDAVEKKIADFMLQPKDTKH
jgi:hypothetical protein